MKKHIIIYLGIIILFTTNIVLAQVEISDAFKKTVEKIFKERVRQGVIEWLSEEEPVIGILGRDLIGQVINSAEKDDLINSITNVVTTTVFIYNVQDIIKSSVADSIYKNILQQAAQFGWDEKKLLAYSGLYFYYSERIKFNLYISPYIFSMEDIKRNMESLMVDKKTRWVSAVSKIMIAKRRNEKDIALDVRILEILQISLLNQINPNLQLKIDSLLIKDLLKYYNAPLESDDLYKLVEYWKANKIKESLSLLFDAYTRSIKKRISSIVKSDGYSAIPFDLKVLNELLSNYVYLVNAVADGLFGAKQFESNAIKTTAHLIDSWIENYNSDTFRFDYGFMLASSYINKDDKLRFIVLDQLRFGYFEKNWALFMFVSGVIDPLLQEALDSNNKVYLAGLGYKYTQLSLSIGAGIPYENLKLKNSKLAVSVGYEVPILDLFGSE